MNRPKPSFVDIDNLQSQVGVETVCRFYGADPGALQRIGKDIRTKCFLNCGKGEETGDRAIAIDADSAVKRWRCHQYGCGKGGNLVTMCDLLKAGENYNGKSPRGQRFKDIRDDLRQMVGDLIDKSAATSEAPTKSESPGEAKEVRVNVLLAESPNERARQLLNLDEKFVVVADQNMNKDAAAYLRKHPFLTPEVCRQERCGYLPRPGNSGDHRGGTLQGMWVYCYRDEEGRPLTWFGRNLKFEEQHAQWKAGGRLGREPSKFHFVKGFHRGLEIYGQHEWNDENAQRTIRENVGALILVEGANDRIALTALGLPAFAICSNIITSEQAAKASQKARELDVPVAVMFDTDEEGENGARTSIATLAQHGKVRLVWSRAMFGGQFDGLQPEDLDFKAVRTIRSWLRE